MKNYKICNEFTKNEDKKSPFQIKIRNGLFYLAKRWFSSTTGQFTKRKVG